MSDVTRILSQIEQGDPAATEQLLPLVYQELRKLASRNLARESADQTLQATALVHEAFLRLVDQTNPLRWENSRHFFAAAAEAMRRIMVDAARRKRSLKRGGDVEREPYDDVNLAVPEPDVDLCDLDHALAELQKVDPQAYQLVHLRYFAGLTSVQAAEMMGISPRTADRIWAYARAWLRKAMR